MTRAEFVAMLLCCGFLTVFLLAAFGHPMPLACWLSAAAVSVYTKERAK